MKNIVDIMYRFEHQLMPGWLFEKGPKFIEQLFENEDFMFSVVQTLAEKNKVTINYRKGQFDVNGGRVSKDKDVIAIMLDYPHPEESPLCYCAFILCDLELGHPMYFAIEKNVSKKSDNPVIKVYTSAKEHKIIGESSFDDHQEYYDCLKYYEESINI